MLLTRLKYWREMRGYSVRELAERSKVAYPAVSLLENGKREPQGRTARKLAQALDVEVTDLYEQAPAAQEPTQSVNDNKTVTAIKPARSRAKKQTAVNSFWVIEQGHEDDDPFRADSPDEAERLKERLGGQHQARVYEAASKAAARELHLAFLIRVVRGFDAW